MKKIIGLYLASLSILVFSSVSAGFTSEQTKKIQEIITQYPQNPKAIAIKNDVNLIGSYGNSLEKISANSVLIQPIFNAIQSAEDRVVANLESFTSFQA